MGFSLKQLTFLAVTAACTAVVRSAPCTTPPNCDNFVCANTAAGSCPGIVTKTFCDAQCVTPAAGTPCGPGSDRCNGDCGCGTLANTSCFNKLCCTKNCPADPTSCAAGSDGCGGACSCVAPKTCQDDGTCSCVPSCPAGYCGPNGCGGTCTCPGTGATTCVSNTCTNCEVPCSIKIPGFATPIPGTCKTAKGPGDLDNPTGAGDGCIIGCNTKCYIPQNAAGLCSQASNSPCSKVVSPNGCLCYLSKSSGKSCGIDNLTDAEPVITSGGCAENQCTKALRLLRDDPKAVGACCGFNCNGRRSLFEAVGLPDLV